jgi:ADP-ribose pyrophosphatase YjhB (NUDIX family)
LTCYRVLGADQDPRAEELLKTAHGLLQEQAAKITDEQLRHSFLENVATHRELVQAFEQTC